MNRRRFLGQLGLMSLGAIASTSTHNWIARAATPSPNAPRLVVIFLRGAVDGLNVVTPYREREYYQGRPNIAIPQPGTAQGLINLDNTFGLHPALSDVFPLWQQGSLSFVHACGSQDPSRSHFDAQDYMETGTPGTKATIDGWMNRLIGVLSENDPIQAVNVGKTTPRILSGRQPVATIPTGKNIAGLTPLDRPQISTAFDRLYNGSDELSQAYREGRAAREALLKTLKELEEEQNMANNGGNSPYGFPKDALRVAQIMARDSRVQLAFMALGDWDTHINQGGSQGRLAQNLKQLGLGLAALQKGLGPVYENTTVLVMSEFGRTVQENGNNGTDHGHGNVMWVLGGEVRGGKVYGKWPGIATTDLYEGRDLAVTTDFRDVISAVLGDRFGLDSTQLGQIFPGFSASGSTFMV